ncbi:hypothetical protein P3H15_00115 [Rhodococcus sp. T2V]|uniref:hypothetical protein n=1 Tax=Rhodococcus sp. T2V TaxID=3034164 RepID=UPI0023E2357F|nr:hypothetical protein [Rhodococcus sp. T2V]MDF3303411.1 hypothetical protein [Rhodococcus sp. T2V]
MNIRCYLAHVGPNLCAFDNGSEFINHHLLAWCEKRKITFTRSRPGNSNDGCHVEQKNWAIVRTVVGNHRYDTEAELVLLNRIWVLQSQLANYFCPQQKLVSKVRNGAKVAKKYDTATTPHRRAEHHKAVGKHDKETLADTYTGIIPAAVQRRIQALTTELLTITTSKSGRPNLAPPRAHSHMSQRIRLRAHLDLRQQVVGETLPASTTRRATMTAWQLPGSSVAGTSRRCRASSIPTKLRAGAGRCSTAWRSKASPRYRFRSVKRLTLTLAVNDSNRAST